MVVRYTYKNVASSTYRQFRKCKGCGKRFELPHRGRYYCDKCRHGG